MQLRFSLRELNISALVVHTPVLLRCSPEDSSPEETVIQAPAPTPPAADAPKIADTASPEKALSVAEDASTEQVVPESVVENKAPEGKLYKEQLAKLAELGFTDGAQNVALLEKYGGDLPKTINDLVTVNEWDPMLQELEEMVSARR